jgi:hypothetical protein
MVNTLELCIISSIFIIVVLIALLVLASRKVKGGELPEENLNLLLSNLAFHMQNRTWQPKVDPYKGKITVAKDSFISTDIHFVQKSNGRIEMFHSPNAAVFGWVLVIVLIFVFSLAAIALAIILHVMSRNFAKNEVIPFIIHVNTYYPPMHPNYPPPPAQFQEPQITLKQYP